jgi:hypothetical protein
MEARRRQVFDALRLFQRAYPAQLAQHLKMRARDVRESLWSLVQEGAVEHRDTGTFEVRETPDSIQSRGVTVHRPSSAEP